MLKRPRRKGVIIVGSITLDIGQWILAFVAAMGVPSAIMGVCVWRFEHKIAKRDKEREDKDAAQERLLLLLVRSNGAALALGEATAKAVQRIPDAHCNGDMHAALEYATRVKHEQKRFLEEQGVHALAE